MENSDFMSYVYYFSIRPNSGGQGLYKGGNEVICRLRFLESITATILSSYRIIPPFGLLGREPEIVGKNYVIRKDRRLEALAGTAMTEINSEEIFVIETPGGGRYGNQEFRM